jgi:non-ribosomal peptide synthetase component F
MNMRTVVPMLFALAFAGAAFAQDATTATSSQTVVTEGDTLLVERVQQENTAAMPARGMTMQQVEAKYGKPSNQLDPRGGQKRQWPTINRWTYPTFTVYFEKSRVIDAVANKADANEVGPKPAIR